MVESKSVVLQMIPHTLFIEWDFWILFMALFTSLYCSWHCSLAVTVYKTVHYPFYCSLDVGTVHDTIQ